MTKPTEIDGVPEGLRAIARAAFSGQPTRPDGTLLLDSCRNPWQALDDALAAAMPSYEAIVRAKVADEIEAEYRRRESDGLAIGPLLHAADIARGQA